MQEVYVLVRCGSRERGSSTPEMMEPLRAFRTRVAADEECAACNEDYDNEQEWDDGWQEEWYQVVTVPLEKR